MTLVKHEKVVGAIHNLWFRQRRERSRKRFDSYGRRKHGGEEGGSLLYAPPTKLFSGQFLGFALHIQQVVAKIRREQKLAVTTLFVKVVMKNIVQKWPEYHLLRWLLWPLRGTIDIRSRQRRSREISGCQVRRGAFWIVMLSNIRAWWMGRALKVCGRRRATVAAPRVRRFGGIVESVLLSHSAGILQ